MAEGDLNRPDDGIITKNGPAGDPNHVDNGVEEEPNFSDEEGFVDNITDAGEY